MAKPLPTAIVRRPKFDLRFVTETSEYHIVSDTKRPDNNFMTESIISMSTKNAMEDDSSAFSFVIAGDMEWDKILNENDMVILKVEPEESYPGSPNRKDIVKNNTLVVGLVSEVRLEGTYDEDTKMYRVTGQSFAKAFMQFELRAVQNVTFMNPTMGWMDGKGDFTGFSMDLVGSSVAQLVDKMMDRFMEYMKYYFNNKESDNSRLQTRIERSISSWEEDEHLVNPISFTNFEGSFNQLLKEIVQRPFCEMFFDVYTDDDNNEKANFVVRRTPFDKEDWNNLTQHQLSTRDVVSEQLARTDLDAFSIFNVTADNYSDSMPANLDIKPKFHPSLVEKYGYKMLSVTHKYLMPTSITVSDNSLGREPGSLTDGIGGASGTTSIEEDNTSGASTNKLSEYSERLYNWYVMNPNFYSGTLKVIGHPDYRLGNRLLYRDDYNNDLWEFYIESVEHDFSYTNGYTTTLGVTRGLRLKSKKDDGGRFNPPMGKAEDFKGGYLGEMSLADIEAYTANTEENGLGANGQAGANHGLVEGDPSDYAKAAADFGLQFVNNASGLTAYHWGGGRQSTNPLLGKPPYKLDCSSFVYWCYKYAGVQLANSNTSHNTTSIKTTNALYVVGKIGSGLNPRNLTYGDIVYFNNDKHMGIYVGNGEFVGFNGSGYNNYDKGCEKRSMTSGYWKNKFQGHVLRY